MKNTSAIPNILLTTSLCLLTYLLCSLFHIYLTLRFAQVFDHALRRHWESRTRVDYTVGKKEPSSHTCMCWTQHDAKNNNPSMHLLYRRPRILTRLDSIIPFSNGTVNTHNLTFLTNRQPFCCSGWIFDSTEKEGILNSLLGKLF